MGVAVESRFFEACSAFGSAINMLTIVAVFFHCWVCVSARDQALECFFALSLSLCVSASLYTHTHNFSLFFFFFSLFLSHTPPLISFCLTFLSCLFSKELAVKVRRTSSQPLLVILPHTVRNWVQEVMSKIIVTTMITRLQMFFRSISFLPLADDLSHPAEHVGNSILSSRRSFASSFTVRSSKEEKRKGFIIDILFILSFIHLFYFFGKKNPIQGAMRPDCVSKYSCGALSRRICAVHGCG